MTTQKISKEIENLNSTINQPQPTDIYKNIPPNKTRTHILFRCPWNILQDRPYVKQ